MKKFTSLYLLLPLFVIGCASDVRMAARKVGITTISVDPQIRADEEMRMGVKSQSGLLTAEISGLIVNGIYSKRRAELSSNMLQNRIDVPEMVRDTTVKMLRDEKQFTVVGDGGDAILSVSIKQHGFSDSGLSFTRKVPFIYLRAELNRNGKRIWRGQGEANPVRAHGLGARWEEYNSNPQVLRQHWQTQVERAVRDLLMVSDKTAEPPDSGKAME